MKQIVLIIFLVSCIRHVHAQGSIHVKAGDDIAMAYSPSGFYRFPEFLEASFIMKDGQTAKTKANYSILTGAVHYISQRGDTLAFSSPERLALVTIGNTSFVYDKYFMEIISNNDSLKLAKRTLIKLQMEKKGGYGEPAPSASMDNYTSLLTSASVFSLKLHQEVIVITQNSYFWLDYRNNAVPATKRNIDKLVVADGRPRVQAFIAQHDVNFNKEGSLLELARFAASYARR